MEFIINLIKNYIRMNFDHIDSGHFSESAFIIVFATVLLGSISDHIPTLQFVSYLIGSLVGLGTLMLNFDKYLEAFKKKVSKKPSKDTPIE